MNRAVRHAMWAVAMLIPAGLTAVPRVGMPAAHPAPALAQTPFEVYFNDEDESPGSVYRYRPDKPVNTVYTRPSGRLASFSTYYLPHKLYFVSGSNGNIYRVDYVNGQWQTPQVIFTHQTYVRDIAFLEDGGQTPTLYFSESSGAGGDGRIFALEYGKAVEKYRVRLNQVHGYWAGGFAYDGADVLHLSSGNTNKARIYRVTGGVPNQIYQAPSGGIMGFAHVGGAVYYGDNHEHIYRVRLSDGHRTLVHDSPTHTGISDIQTMGDEPAFPTETPTRTPTTVPTSTPTTVPSSTATRTPTTVPTSTSTVTATTVPSSTPTVTPTTVPSSTATSTAVSTSTSTTVPTSTSIPTVVPTVSATPADTGRLTGLVSLDGRTDHGGVAVGVDGTNAATTDADGRFEVGGLPPGEHTVDLRRAGYVSAGARPFTVQAGADTELPSAVLLGGDANRDDEIDIVDAAIVTASFDIDAGQPGFDTRADINEDGTVDIFDLVMVGANFGCRTSDEAGRCRRWLDR